MRTDFKLQSEAGFTLTELMVTVAIFGIVLTAVYAAFTSQFNSWQTQEDVATVQADIRTAAEMLTRDIRNAGFGVPTGSGVTTVAAANGSSITLNLAGTTSSTYVTSTNYTITGSAPNFTYVIPVFSTTGFSNVSPSNTYNVIDIRTKTVKLGNVSGNKITQVGPGNFLTVTGNLAQNFVLNVGDIIVSPGSASVKYSLAGTTLSRTDPVTGNPVTLSNNINNVNGFTLNYIMTDGTTTSTPASMANIAAVNFTINGQTSQNISKLRGQQRTRTVNAIVALRNY